MVLLFGAICTVIALLLFTASSWSAVIKVLGLHSLSMSWRSGWLFWTPMPMHVTVLGRAHARRLGGSARMLVLKTWQPLQLNTCMKVPGPAVGMAGAGGAWIFDSRHTHTRRRLHFAQTWHLTGAAFVAAHPCDFGIGAESLGHFFRFSTSELLCADEGADAAHA